MEEEEEGYLGPRFLGPWSATLWLHGRLWPVVDSEGSSARETDGGAWTGSVPEVWPCASLPSPGPLSCGPAVASVLRSVYGLGKGSLSGQAEKETKFRFQKECSRI